MNTQHLEQLIHDLQNLPEKRFNMENGYIYTEETPIIWTNADVRPLCGCVGAWVNFWYTNNTSSGTLALQEFLEITPDEAEYIFLGLFDDSDCDLKEIKKEMAIDYLQKCLEADKILMDEEYLQAIQR